MRRVYLYPMNYRGVFFRADWLKIAQTTGTGWISPALPLRYPEAMEEGLNSTETLHSEIKQNYSFFLWLAKKPSKTESNGFMRPWKGLRKLFINTITFSKIMNRLWPFYSMLLKTFDVWPPWANNKGGLSLTLLDAQSLFSQLLMHIALNTGKHLWKSQASIRLLHCQLVFITKSYLKQWYTNVFGRKNMFQTKNKQKNGQSRDI